LTQDNRVAFATEWPAIVLDPPFAEFVEAQIRTGIVEKDFVKIDPGMRSTPRESESTR
jgi:hypothetical protein